MFTRISVLFGAEVRANSEELGHVADFLVEGNLSALLYLLIAPSDGEVGTELPVPISAAADLNLAQRSLFLGLSKKELDHLAGIDLLNRPSREKERIIHDLLHWRPYWMQENQDVEPDLHSLKRTLGLRVVCSDGPVGALDDFFASATDWSAPLLELNCAQHLKRRLSLVPTESIESVNWPQQLIRLTATRQHIETAPEYEGQASLTASEVQAALRHFRSAGKPS